MRDPWNAQGRIDPMKIVAFYEEVGRGPDEAKLIDMWAQAWTRAGFEPEVLSLKDAKRHPRFEELSAKARTYPTVNNPEFEWLCFVRWCAFQNSFNGIRNIGIITDYDVFPVKDQVEIEDQLHDLSINEMMNFDPDSGPGLIASGSLGIVALIDRLITYTPDGTELTFERLHVSDLTIIQKCRDLFCFPIGENPPRVAVYDAEDKWKTAVAVHFGGAYRRRPDLPRWKEIKEALNGNS